MQVPALRTLQGEEMIGLLVAICKLEAAVAAILTSFLIFSVQKCKKGKKVKTTSQEPKNREMSEHLKKTNELSF